MKASARAELRSIKSELNSIINELDDISNGVRRDFTGIGNDQCANCIDRVAEKYRWVKRKLDTMNTSEVREGFI